MTALRNAVRSAVRDARRGAFIGYDDPSLTDAFVNQVSGAYTFSRTGGQTGINSASQIYQAERKNLLLYSEQFDNAAWVTNGTVTKTPNYATAPNGTQTADRLVFTAATSANQIFQTFTSSALGYTTSVWMRVESGSKQIKLGFFDGTSVLNDYVTLTTTWQRFTVNKQVVAFGATRGCWIYPENAGDATDIIIWGAQAEPGPTATAYIPTTSAAVTVSDPAYIAGQGILLEGARTNLLTYSRDMTNAAWGKADTTVTRNQTGADGAASSACLITEGSAGTAQTTQLVAQGAGTYTAGFILKRGNTDWVFVNWYDSTNFATARMYVNLATGAKGVVAAIGANMSGVSGAVVALGGGWYKCTVTGTIAGNTNIVWQISSALADNNLTRVSGATYIVDYAQLEAAPFASSPIETVAAAVTRNATSLSRNWTLPANNFSGQIKFRPQFARGELVSQTVFGLSDGTVNNRYVINLSATGYFLHGKYVGGVSVFSGAATSLNFTKNQLINIRFKQDPSGISLWVNSEPVIKVTTSVAPDDYNPGLTQIWLNQPLSGFSVGFTVFESLKLWHESKSDAFLAALT